MKGVGTKVNNGSTMSLLVHEVLPDDPAQNLANLWKEILVEYDVQNIPLKKRFGSLRMSMFSKVCVSLRSIIDLRRVGPAYTHIENMYRATQ